MTTDRIKHILRFSLPMDTPDSRIDEIADMYIQQHGVTDDSDVIETLLEDYKRKLKTANEMADDMIFKDVSNPDYVRVKIKASCYRTFISEIERLSKLIK